MLTGTYTQAVDVRRLPNGMTVSMERLPHVRSISAGVWIRTGSADETPRESGISHLLEHLFFKGTATRTARQLVEAIESKGGQFNAFTSREFTCVYVKTLDTYTATGIEILADVIRHSQFYDLEKERNVILEEIASNEDVPEDYVHDILAERFWPGHPLGRPIAGTEETVSVLGLADVRAFYERWYRPENILFSIAGNFDPDLVYAQIAQAFDGMPDGPLPDRVTAPAASPGVHRVERDIAQTHVCFCFPSVPVAEDRRYVGEVLSSALGGGSTSRLFEKIREEQGLAYSVYSFHSVYSVSGAMGVYAAVAPENLDQTLEIAFEEIRDLRDRPMTEYETALNRDQLKGGFLMGLESTSTRMARMAKSLLYHGRVIPVDEVVNAIDTVTPEDVHTFAAEQFRPDRCALVLLGPAGAEVGAIPL